MKYINFKCLSCGKEVSIRRPKNKAKYCSLECYRTGNRISRRTGKIIIFNCEFCGNKVEKYYRNFNINKNHFCGIECANKYQGRNKIKFICKICGNNFYLSKSSTKDNNPTYCSWDCRIKDKEHIFNNAIKANVAQQNKKGFNKLELAGRKILKDIGIDFQEQVLMFNKFLVDVLIPSKNIIIQWDGVYWHTKPKRVLLDKSQDAYLKKCGYNVIRITDIEIKNNLKNVYDNIKRAIQ